MAVAGEIGPHTLKFPGAGLAEKVKTFLKKQTDAVEDVFLEPPAEGLQFSPEEIQILKKLGHLELASTINRIYEIDEDESHFWLAKRGRVGVHIKRLDDTDYESVRHTHAFVRFDSNGNPGVLHLYTHLEAMGSRAMKGFEEAHLRVGHDPVPSETILEEVDELGYRLQQAHKSSTDQIAD